MSWGEPFPRRVTPPVVGRQGLLYIKYLAEQGETSIGDFLGVGLFVARGRGMYVESHTLNRSRSR